MIVFGYEIIISNFYFPSYKCSTVVSFRIIILNSNTKIIVIYQSIQIVRGFSVTNYGMRSHKSSSGTFFPSVIPPLGKLR